MLKKIPVSELRLGMFIDSFCGSWMEHPFWKDKLLLKTPKDLERILGRSIGELWIDTSKGLDIEADHPQQSESQAHAESEAQLHAASSVHIPAHISLEAELDRAAKLCSDSKQAVMQMFGEMRMGKAADTEKPASWSARSAPRCYAIHTHCSVWRDLKTPTNTPICTRWRWAP